MGRALDGLRTVLMVSASESPERVRQHHNVVDAAVDAGRAYGLTGPVALSLDEVAGIMTRTTRAVVRHHRETLEEAYALRRGYGAPDWQVEACVSTYTAIASGELAA